MIRVSEKKKENGEMCMAILETFQKTIMKLTKPGG